MKYAARLCIFFSLIPNLMSNMKKLKQLDTWKMIAKKFIKATLFYGLAACLPSLINCRLGPYFKSMGQLSCLFNWGLGIAIAFAFEAPARHAQLMSFYFPKAMDILFTWLEQNGFPKQPPGFDTVVVLFAAIVVAIQSLRDFKKRVVSQDSDVKEPEKKANET